MPRRTVLLIVLLGLALLVTTVGWLRASDRIQIAEDKPQRFEGCTFDGQQLVLDYMYGVGQLIAPTVDTRPGDKIVVSLETEKDDGDRIMIGLGGRAEFTVNGFDLETPIEYEDGARLDCDRVAPQRS